MAGADEPIEVVVETPRGSRNKYGWTPSGYLRLNRVLYSAVHYPADYGIVEGTRDEDGASLDALILISEPTFPGCHVPVRLIGVLETHDRRGVDHKLLCVPLGDPRFNSVHDLLDLDPHWLREIETFFATYKDLEAEDSEVVGWSDATAAHRVLAEARARATAAL